MTNQCSIKEFVVLGCVEQTPGKPVQAAFKSTIFAKTAIKARLLFFKLLKNQKKLKRSKVVIVDVKEVPQAIVDVKTFGINLTYRSNKESHNIYREFRAVNNCDAVETMFESMAGTHGVSSDLIQIMDVFEVKDEDIRRKKNLELSNTSDLVFPVFKKTLINSKIGLVKKSEKAFY